MEKNMKTVFSALVAFSVVMLVVSSAEYATVVFTVKGAMGSAGIWPMNAAFLQQMVVGWAGETASFTNAGSEHRISRNRSEDETSPNGKAVVYALAWRAG